MTARAKPTKRQFSSFIDNRHLGYLPTIPEGNVFRVPDTGIELAPGFEESLWSEFFGFWPDFVVSQHRPRRAYQQMLASKSHYNIPNVSDDNRSFVVQLAAPLG